MTEYDKYAIAPPYITHWLRENSAHNDAFLTELEQYAAENNIPIAQPETARFLSVMCGIIKPRRMLEIGTAIGYSAIIAARAMGGNGTILTLEYDERIARTARGNIARAGLSDRIEVVCADAKDYLSYIDEDECMDFIFLDGPKAHYVYMLDDCVRLLRRGGVLISDNVLYKGMTADDEHVVRRKITIVERLREYIAALTNHPELDTALLPLGDGVTVSVKI